MSSYSRLVLTALVVVLTSTASALRCQKFFSYSKPGTSVGGSAPIPGDCPATAKFCVVGNGTITYPDDPVFKTEVYPVDFQDCDTYLATISSTYLDNVSGLDCNNGKGPHSLTKSVPDPKKNENYQLVSKWTCDTESNAHDDAAKKSFGTLSLIVALAAIVFSKLQ